MITREVQITSHWLLTSDLFHTISNFMQNPLQIFNVKLQLNWFFSTKMEIVSLTATLCLSLYASNFPKIILKSNLHLVRVLWDVLDILRKFFLRITICECLNSFCSLYKHLLKLSEMVKSKKVNIQKITWLTNSCKQTQVTASAVEKVSEEFWRTFSLWNIPWKKSESKN